MKIVEVSLKQRIIPRNTTFYSCLISLMENENMTVFSYQNIPKYFSTINVFWFLDFISVQSVIDYLNFYYCKNLNVIL